MNSYLNRDLPVPHALTLALSWLFAILYGVWLLPNTVFTRNVCLIAGALLSLLVIVPRWRLLLQKRAAPIWLIAILFLWITFHLFFIGQDYSTQLMEYTKSWKKIFISSVFAVGLGMAIVSNFKDPKRLAIYWRVIYFGLMLPMVIYFIKLGTTTWAPLFGIELSPHLMISREIFTDPFAVHRSGYVFFVMPALAIGIAKLAHAMLSGKFSPKENLIYIVTILMTVALFHVEDDRLGYLFVALLLLMAAIPVGNSLLKKSSIFKLISLVLLLFSITSVGVIAYRQNDQWKTLIADAKVGIQVDRYDAWKYSRTTRPDLPLNEFEKPASLSNYERTAWATAGSRLALSNPLGYGLMSQSFGRLCRIYWPDAETSWSHSAWLDFTLGYGVIGLLLLLVASLLAWNVGGSILEPWKLIGKWGLGSLVLVFLVKEVSSEVYINALIFLVMLVTALALRFPERQV
ncbi:O-antigen ligase family protein [Polynucleobacter sp. 71A-WALBACH]|uniref:O-antigen ligase family protein n=1 Tax=Polynucleobacter sp. 71A-WALBACH TaxID=2689097 RepID=UPI001C0BFF53|nr:O-antigen ligase family protein [Polynucleobacter sp. 71A-WALBACH]MBU3593259.1 O-antigen ligase family protein [Polynucleobacter sp. 71A-WALBACH]